MQQHCLLTAIAVITLLASCTAMPAKNVRCTLGDQHYNVNDTWHPIMNTLGDRDCVNCTCMPDGEVSCVPMSCPKPTCAEPRLIQGECCFTCDVKDSEEEQGVSPGEGEEEERDCTHHGHTYKHLDVFPSNHTNLKPQNDSQCVMCNCYDGKVMCLVQLCLPNPACKKMVSVKDDCCQQCQDDKSKTALSTSGARRKEKIKQLGQGACWWHRSRKDNGTTWNPVVAGVVSCVSCTCVNGDVTCDRENCPSGTLLPCSETEPGTVCDCEACPKKRDKKGKKGKEKRKKKSKRNKRKKCADGSKKKCSSKGKKRRKKSKGAGENKSTSASSIFPPELKLNEAIDRLCMPKKADLIMYHIRGDKFEAVAFDGPGQKSIQEIRWKIKRGRLRGDPLKNMVLDLNTFRQKINIREIVGAVKKNQIKRFLNIMEKRRRRCKKPCRRKLVGRLVKKVKSMQIDLTKSCSVH